MKPVIVTVEDVLYEFYKKVGQQAGGLSAEKVMADALFKLAGDLSVEMLQDKNKTKSK